MFLIKYKILFWIVIIRTYADDFISEERNEQSDRKEKNTFSKVERRALDISDDETWHISHLKDTDFSARRSGCPEDTFEDKVRKYRRTLQSDGALVEFVSADALPFNEADLIKDVCKLPDKKDVFFKALKSEAKADREQETAKLGKNETQRTETNEKGATETTSTDGPEILNVATTTTKKQKEHKEKPPAARKANEYQFSSIEYYDEAIDFDTDEICPDDVEEIVLDIDHIRNYDVKCEQLLEWRSLE